ncbi:MAG: HNH endonuclease signature motif containing protein [Nitrososphaerota archaeon]
MQHLRDEKGRWVKGHPVVPEWEDKRREAISIKLRGRKFSEETLKKMSEVQKKLWAQRKGTPEEKVRTEKIKKTIRKKIEQGWRVGPKNPSWNGGHYKGKDGYVRILVPDWPSATKDGYVLEHRYVMEKALGRILKENEQIHHKNGIKDDNRLENLEILIKKTHMGRVNCPYCGKEFKVM